MRYYYTRGVHGRYLKCHGQALYTKSYDLLHHGPFPPTSEYSDNVFLLAHTVLSEANLYAFIIEEDLTPTTRMNENIKLDVPLVQDLAKDKTFSLISANMMLCVDTYGYPVLRRDGGTRFYPFCYTCPAGRCEQPPMATAIAEANEEILITLRHTQTNALRILGFGDENVALAGKKHHEHELHRELPGLVICDIEWEDGPDTYLLISRSKAGEDHLVESGHATVVFDASTNAYEICFKATVKLPNGWIIQSFEDGERFGREALFTRNLSDLDKSKCVYALQAFLERTD